MKRSIITRGIEYIKDNVFDQFDITDFILKDLKISKTPENNFIYFKEMNKKIKIDPTKNEESLSINESKIREINKNRFKIRIDKLIITLPNSYRIKFTDLFTPIQYIGQGAYGLVISARKKVTNEKYAIKSENIYINFRTFEILILLLFNVYEEKAKIIQKSFLHKYLKNGIFNSFKLKVIKIQRAFILYLLNKYKKKSNDELIDLILKKYKGNDPKLILLIINSKKVIDCLQKENYKLKEKLKSSSITLYKKKQDILQDNKKKNISNKQNKNNKEEIENLKLQLNEATAKYYESVGIIMEYERRMKNFIQSVCSNQKVKDILIKNGIQIN